MKKILIAVPYHERKKYCLDQLYRSINNLSTTTKKAGFEVEVLVRHDLNEFGAPDNVKKQREFFRQQVLVNDHDYLFFHGADTIPPADAIVKMINSGYGILSGVYWQRGENKAMNAIAWFGNDPDEKNIKMQDQFNNHSQIRVDGFGLDCVLISRSVLEQISWFDWPVNDDDYPFCDKATELGFELFIDTSIQCQHWDTPKSYSYNAKFFIH